MSTPRVYQTRQRTDGRWEYTVLREGSAPYVVGYCAGWHYEDGTPLDDEAHARTLAEVLHLKPKYHEDGHDTEEGARRCFNAYLLDRELKAKDGKDEKACIVCGRDTLRIVSMGKLYRWPICIEHDARAAAAALLEQQPSLREETDEPRHITPPPPRQEKPRGRRAEAATTPGPLDPAKSSG